MEQPKRGRKGRPPKTVYMSIGIMANPNTGHIHIFDHDGEVVSTLSNDPESKRYHPNLYMKLRRVLEREGKWPQGMV